MTTRIFSDFTLLEPLVPIRETLAFPELQIVYLEQGPLIALGEGISYFFEVLRCILDRSPNVGSIHVPEDSSALIKLMQSFQHPMLTCRRIDVCTHMDKERPFDHLAENVTIISFSVWYP
jgi:hypothetical protein